MMTMGIMLFAVILMAVLLVLFAVVMLAGMHKESKLNRDFFMSSTSMQFGKGGFQTGTAC
jgi:Tfp pilus assembly protein PilX